MKVVNVRDYGGVEEAQIEGIIYIGRPSLMGNPFSVEKYGREKAIDMYRQYLWAEMKCNKKILSFLDSLNDDSVLGCWCNPKDCHGDVIIRAWKWWKEHKNDFGIFK